MTTFIKKAGLNLTELAKTIVDKVCHDGRFCDDVMMSALSLVVVSIMWLSLAQL
mgnify:CR=1 FL=1